MVPLSVAEIRRLFFRLLSNQSLSYPPSGLVILATHPSSARAALPLQTPQHSRQSSTTVGLDLIGETMYSGAELVIIPVERLDEAFFQLKMGLAGQIIQKFVTYRRRLVVLGDISQYIAQSRAFKDFVYEANGGNQLWFITNLQELDERLKQNT